MSDRKNRDVGRKRTYQGCNYCGCWHCMCGAEKKRRILSKNIPKTTKEEWDEFERQAKIPKNRLYPEIKE